MATLLKSISSIARGLQPPIGPKKKNKKRENALLAYLHGLLVVAQVSSGF